MSNKTINFRLQHLNEIFIEDIVQNMLLTIKEIFHGMQHRYRKQIRPYDIHESITTPDKGGISIFVGDDFKGDISTNIGRAGDKRNMRTLAPSTTMQSRQYAIFSVDPRMGRSFTSSVKHMPNINN